MANLKAAIEREATEVFRVATKCGYGLTKGSESPLTTEASDARISYPESRRNSTKSTAFEVDEIIVSRLDRRSKIKREKLKMRLNSLEFRV